MSGRATFTTRASRVMTKNPSSAAAGAAAGRLWRPVAQGRPMAVVRVMTGESSGGEQGLDGAAFVHRLVAFGGVLQGQGEVEHLAGVDGPVPDQVDQLGQ